MPTWLLFALGLVLIVAASELFTNAVEWAGHRLRLGSGATGSLLAALGTALPETAVPIVALAGRAHDAQQVAIGAVVGAPFLLLTLGLGITGAAVVLRRGDPVLHARAGQVRRDLGATGIALLVLLLGLVLPLGARLPLGLLLLAVYGRHILATLRADTGSGDAPEPLHLMLRRRGDPPVVLIAIQLAGSIAALIYGADLFVEALQETAPRLGISALVLAIVIVPVATELPETLNSVLWVRSGDDALALGNVAGATAFQACVLGAVGLVFTEWRPGAAGVVNLAVTCAACAWAARLLWDGRCRGWRLCLCASGWLAFVALAAATGSRLSPPGG